MSKPGGKPILKERPFFADDKIEIGGILKEGKITGFYFTVKETNERKEFKVVNNEITKAWQELEKAADSIAANLLKSKHKKF